MKRAFGWALLVAGALSVSGIVGCSDHDRIPGVIEHDENGGSIGLQLVLPTGQLITTVTYTVTGPGGLTKTGSFDVSNSNKIQGLIGGLPAGKGYTITLRAKTTDGATSCAGSASFDVKARTTTSVMVGINCREAPRTGSALINGTLNVCPMIDGVTALPSRVFVGESTEISADVHDSDSGPNALTYEWSNSAGKLSSSGNVARFTCTEVGTAAVGLVVGDGDCRDKAKLEVECVLPDECGGEFDAYMSALGEMTADCLGRIDPRDFRINEKGFMEPTFDKCVNQMDILPIRQLLSLQFLSKRTEEPMLPLAKACIAGRHMQALKQFAAMNVVECPTFTLDHAVNPITDEVIQRVAKLLPQPDDKGIIVGPLDERVIPALKVNHVYNVALSGMVVNQGCKNATDCARVCGEFLPTFIIGPENEKQVLTDTSSWLDTTLFDALSPDPYLHAGFYHPMGFTGPTARGVQYGAYNRTLGCPPGVSCAPSDATPGVTSGPEACNYYIGTVFGVARYKQVPLQKYCTNPMDIATCTSYCGGTL